MLTLRHLGFWAPICRGFWFRFGWICARAMRLASPPTLDGCRLFRYRNACCILTGLVVENVIVKAEVDDNSRVMHYRRKKRKQAMELKKLFSRIDKNNKGIITESDFLEAMKDCQICLLYTSPSPRDATLSRMPSSA